MDQQDNDGLSALMHICRREIQDRSIARAMLEGGAQVNLQNKNGWSALMFATQTAWFYGVKLLLEHKADVNLQDEKGKSSLMIAIEKNPPMNFRGKIPESKHLVAEILIEKGAQINLQDKIGSAAT